MSNSHDREESNEPPEQRNVNVLLEQVGPLLLFRTIALGVFHQLANQLHSISSGLLMVEMFSERGHFDRREVVESLERMQRTVRNSLDMVHSIQKRGQTLELTPQQCFLNRDIVRPALDETRARIRGSNIAIEHSLTSKDYHVSVDVGLMREAIINILSNAIWAVRENKRMTNKRVFIAVRELIGQPSVTLTIRDNGIGIPTETLRRVFTPFFTTRPGGTGLGLFFAKLIIEQSKGTIKIARSAHGKGTTIEVSIPILR